MKCYRCRTPIPEHSRYCLSCGADVSEVTGPGGTTATMDAAAAQLFQIVKQEVGSEFSVERELGRGGMAAVLLVPHAHLGRMVAVKVLPPELTFGSSRGMVEPFKREACVAPTLEDPHIIPVHRVSAGDKLPRYLMNCLEGESLESIAATSCTGTSSVRSTVA